MLPALAAGVVLAASPALTACTARHPPSSGRVAAAGQPTRPAPCDHTSGGRSGSSAHRAGDVTAAGRRAGRPSRMARTARPRGQPGRAGGTGQDLRPDAAMDVTDLRVVSVRRRHRHRATAARRPRPSTATTPTAGSGARRRRVAGEAHRHLPPRRVRQRAPHLRRRPDRRRASDPRRRRRRRRPLVIRAWVPADRPQPWDLEGLRVRRTAAALLLVVGSDADARRPPAAHAPPQPSGSPRCGDAPSPRCGSLPAATPTRHACSAATLRSMTGVAAVTDGPLRTGERAGADRIVVVPQAVGGPARSRARRRAHPRADPRHGARLDDARGAATGWPRASPSSSPTRSVRLPEREVVAPALDVVRGARAAGRPCPPMRTSTRRATAGGGIRALAPRRPHARRAARHSGARAPLSRCRRRAARAGALPRRRRGDHRPVARASWAPTAPPSSGSGAAGSARCLLGP